MKQFYFSQNKTRQDGCGTLFAVLSHLGPYRLFMAWRANIGYILELCAAAAADQMSASRRHRFRDVFTSCCTPAICLLDFCNAVYNKA